MGIDFGPTWFWLLVFFLAVVGALALGISLIGLIFWAFNHVTIT